MYIMLTHKLIKVQGSLLMNKITYRMKHCTLIGKCPNQYLCLCTCRNHVCICMHFLDKYCNCTLFYTLDESTGIPFYLSMGKKIHVRAVLYINRLTQINRLPSCQVLILLLEGTPRHIVVCKSR